jgi:hypothetical protein
MYHSLAVQTTSITLGTPLSPTRKPANWVIIQAQSTNSGSIRVFSMDQLSGANDDTAPTKGGTVLGPLDSITMPFPGAPLFYDLSLIFIVALTNAGDGVDISYGA